GGLEGGNGGFAFVPGGFGAEEDPVPVVVGERLAVVVPDSVELASDAELLALESELLNVDEGVIVIWIDAGPVIDAWGDPGLHVGVGERGNPGGVAFGLWVVLPGNGDGGFLEAVGELFDETRIVHGDVSPEEELD